MLLVKKRDGWYICLRALPQEGKDPVLGPFSPNPPDIMDERWDGERKCALTVLKHDLRYILVKTGTLGAEEFIDDGPVKDNAIALIEGTGPGLIVLRKNNRDWVAERPSRVSPLLSKIFYSIIIRFIGKHPGSLLVVAGLLAYFCIRLSSIILFIDSLSWFLVSLLLLWVSHSLKYDTRFIHNGR